MMGGVDSSLRGKKVRRKVYAYITHGNRLLVFRHRDAPEAGVQVPGGTLEEGEAAETGMMREVLEETGLTDLRLGSCLGEVVHPLPALGEVHHRMYYHLIYDGYPPARWCHDEMHPSDGSPAPIRFEFTWASLPDGVPELSGDLDQMLPVLVRELGIRRVDGCPR